MDTKENKRDVRSYERGEVKEKKEIERKKKKKKIRHKQPLTELIVKLRLYESTMID